MKKTHIIHDGDHGGDDFVATMIAALHPGADLRAVTTVLGNAGAERAAHNACLALALCGRGDVPVYVGEKTPYNAAAKAGDNVFSADGLGGIDFLCGRIPPVSGGHALDFMADMLADAAAPVTVCVTGPLTNIAVFMDRHPAAAARIADIIVMGGGIDTPGNITPYAEFNFYMDPNAVRRVLDGSRPITLHMLDSTHTVPFNAPRKEALKSALGGWPHADRLVNLMALLEALDGEKFGLDGAPMHDQHTIIHALAPELYAVEERGVTVNTIDRPGHLAFADGPDARPVRLARCLDGDAFFDCLCGALSALRDTI